MCTWGPRTATAWDEALQWSDIMRRSSTLVSASASSAPRVSLGDEVGAGVICKAIGRLLALRLAAGDGVEPAAIADLLLSGVGLLGDNAERAAGQAARHTYPAPSTLAGPKA